MNITNVILDFDGTLTDIGKESESFQEIYPENFFEYLGATNKDHLTYFKEIKEEISKNPSIGFLFAGFDVASAACDPYILTQSASQEILRRYGERYDNPDLMVELFVKSVGSNSDKGHHLRKDTKLFLDSLINKYDVAIATNSNVERVNSFLSSIGYDNGQIKIIGGAKKLYIQPDFDEVDAIVRPTGFPRDVLLRRKDYFDVLKKLEEVGFKPDKTAVVGDIYELDLALPEHLGYKVIQIQTPYSPEHEMGYHKTRENNFFAKDYDEVLKELN